MFLILQGNFDWLMRSRIRTSYVVSGKQRVIVNYLHEEGGNKELSFMEMKDDSRVLPVLALNEVSSCYITINNGHGTGNNINTVYSTYSLLIYICHLEITLHTLQKQFT